MTTDQPAKPVVCIMGPTASGKTSLAIELVDAFPFEIISVDSALVYRHMNIGTAKPDDDELEKAPHALIDICDPSEAYSAARFCDDARREIDAIRQRGNVPLLVGGTMLYFRALLEGLSDLPAADDETRAQIESEASEVGWPAMHEQLSELDPKAAERINPNDPQRIQRALEVIRLTGQPISSLQGRAAMDSEEFAALRIVVCPTERAELHRRVAVRFEQMLEAGFVDEVRQLRKREDLHAGLPSIRAVGYRQAWAYLEGELGESEWVERALAATRQLAKRQLTWLRREKSALWYDLEKDDARDMIFSAVRNHLLLKG